MSGPGHTRYKAVLHLVEEISSPPNQNGYVATRDVELAEVTVTDRSPDRAMDQIHQHAALLKAAYTPTTSGG